MSEIEEAKERVKRQRYIHSILEGYKNNPSNSNKYFYELMAVIEDDDWSGMEKE